MKFSICLFLSAVANLVSAREDIHVLMYETDSSLENDPTSPLSFFKERSSFADLSTTIYGGGLEYHGFGDKYQTLRSILEVIDPNKLVVVADARDVALNIPMDIDGAKSAIDRFLETYHKLTANNPHAVVMSAEGQCCVSAMTHAHPSEYFDPVTKKRNKRACSSGKPGCYWDQNDNIYAWVDFHRQRAYNKTGIERVGDHVGDVYLNAGLMAGYPEDLINLVEVLDIAPAEDDQAVLSGLMYQFPDMIVLDYEQEMFGNNQWPLGLEKGCVFETSDKSSASTQNTLVHKSTNTEPLIIHTPGKFYGCLDMLIEELGGTSQKRYLQDSPSGNPRKLQNESQMSEISRRLMGKFLTRIFDKYIMGKDDEETTNYGEYGQYGNAYGQYGNVYGNYGGQYGGRRLFGGFIERIVGKMKGSTEEIEIEPEMTSKNYGQYGVESTNYGGQYGLVENANYGYGNYGEYGNYGLRH